MPEKTSKNGHAYAIDGKTLRWPTDDGEVTIPLRLKLKALRSVSDRDLNDVSTMFTLIESVVPNQADVLDEMDVLDFTDMFSTWHTEYNALNGASLGESSGSST